MEQQTPRTPGQEQISTALRLLDAAAHLNAMAGALATQWNENVTPGERAERNHTLDVAHRHIRMTMQELGRIDIYG